VLQGVLAFDRARFEQIEDCFMARRLGHE